MPTKTTSTLWLLPPALLTFFGMRDAKRHGRRRRQVTEWVLAIRYALTGHYPIVRLGARRASRSERLPLGKRWQMLAAVTGAIAPATVRPVWAMDETTATDAGPYEGRPTGRVVAVEQRPRLESTNSLMVRLVGRKKKTA